MKPDLNKGIRVTEIASQYWCERKVELSRIYTKAASQEQKKGRQLHYELEVQTNVPIMLQPKTYSDSLFSSLYKGYVALEALLQNGITREVQIYGEISGYKITGKIDELRLQDGEVIVYETKTRDNDTVPSESQQFPNRIQVMLYKKLLDNVISKKYDIKNFTNRYGINSLFISPDFSKQLDDLQVDKDSRSIRAMADKFFTAMSKISKTSSNLYISYINQHTRKEIKQFEFKYDEAELNGALDFAMKYWLGERNALPVPESEKWKCRWCPFFGKECTVWWPQKVL